MRGKLNFMFQDDKDDDATDAARFGKSDLMSGVRFEGWISVGVTAVF